MLTFFIFLSYEYAIFQQKQKFLKRIFRGKIATFQRLTYVSITIVDFCKKMSKILLTFFLCLFYYRSSETQNMGFSSKMVTPYIVFMKFLARGDKYDKIS